MISVGRAAAQPILALGGELKNTVCLYSGAEARLTATHGDLSDGDSFRRFRASVGHLLGSAAANGCTIAHDLHPTYGSSIYARTLLQPRIAVQHHHAHAVSCAVDAGADFPVIAIVCDGTGYGTDGAIWGGEVLYCEAGSFRRIAHLCYFPLPGGDLSARQTWRPALAMASEALIDEEELAGLPAMRRVQDHQRRLVTQQMEREVNTPTTSSLGRLFDGVSFLCGLCDFNRSEGQAARALQEAAAGRPAAPYSYAIEPASADGHGKTTAGGSIGSPRSEDLGHPAQSGDGWVLDWRPMLREIISDLRRGVGNDTVGARFHTTLVRLFGRAAIEAARQYETDRVVLSGGCFMNPLLCNGLRDELAERGLRVFTHRQVSTGDAGISLGQAVAAAAVTSMDRNG